MAYEWVFAAIPAIYSGVKANYTINMFHTNEEPRCLQRGSSTTPASMHVLPHPWSLCITLQGIRQYNHSNLNNYDRKLFLCRRLFYVFWDGIGVTVFLIAGLDERFRWSPGSSTVIHLFNLAFFVLGNVIIGWSMASNKFFSMYGIRGMPESS